MEFEKNYCYFRNQYPYIFQEIALGTKLFRLEFDKAIVIFEINNLNFISLNLGPKMSYLDIFKLEFENTIAIFEISALELV